MDFFPSWALDGSFWKGSRISSLLFDSESTLRVDPFAACARRSGFSDPCAGIESTSCRELLFLPTPSVTLPVTTSAKRHQVVYHIVTEPAPGLHVMDLQAFQGSALLAPPTI